MNNAKIWLVVKPTVGLPLFLGAVAATSLFVHYNLLKNTTWVPTFFQGKPKKAATLEAPRTQTGAVVVLDERATVATGRQEGVVMLPDGRTGRVVFDEPAPPAATLASSSASLAR